MKEKIQEAAKVVANVTPRSWREELLHSPFSGVARRLMNLFLDNEYTVVTVQSGLIEGLKMCLYLKSEKANWFGLKESRVQHVLSKYVDEGVVAYDVGAKVGYITLMLARLVGKKGKVFAFEPLPDNAKRLQKNIKLNNLQDTTKIFNIALSNRSDTCTFLTHEKLGMGRLEEAQRDSVNLKSKIDIKCKTLDSIVLSQECPKPDFIKIDVEGGESLVLEGANKVMEKYNPTMVIEMHSEDVTYKCFRILKENNYQIRDIDNSLCLVKSPDSLGGRSYVLALPQA